MLLPYDVKAYSIYCQRKKELENKQGEYTEEELKELRNINNALHSYSVTAISDLEAATMEDAREEQENVFETQRDRTLWQAVKKTINIFRRG